MTSLARIALTKHRQSMPVPTHGLKAIHMSCRMRRSRSPTPISLSGCRRLLTGAPARPSGAILPRGCAAAALPCGAANLSSSISTSCTSAGLPALLLACPVMQPLLSPPPGLKLPDCRAAYGCSLPASCLLLSALGRGCSFLAHGINWGVIRQLCGLTHGIGSIMRQPASIPCQHRAAV